jgi:hypothetical protein
MKKVLRFGVFETNSSNTHALSFCMRGDYDEWEKGNKCFFIDGVRNEKITVIENSEEAIKEKFKSFCETHTYYDKDSEKQYEDWKNEYIFKNEEEWLMDKSENFDTYTHFFKLPDGQEIAVFGYYGYDS